MDGKIILWETEDYFTTKETAKDLQRFPEKELSREVEHRGLGMDAVPKVLR